MLLLYFYLFEFLWILGWLLFGIFDWVEELAWTFLPNDLVLVVFLIVEQLLSLPFEEKVEVDSRIVYDLLTILFQASNEQEVLSSAQLVCASWTCSNFLCSFLVFGLAQIPAEDGLRLCVAACSKSAIGDELS